MIQITSTVQLEAHHREEALAVAVEHVARSRTEPGCISHDVFVDPENPARFFFFERWKDQAAVDAHFREPTSQAFVAQLRPWVSEPMSLEICQIAEEHVQRVG